MLNIGLTGGIGSGKSQVAHVLAEQGAVIVDTDVIAHDLTGPQGAAMPAIQQAFGADVVQADGALDRAAMRNRVFADAALRTRLEQILHPLIQREAWARAKRAQTTQTRQQTTQTRQQKRAQAPYVVFVVPLLAEGKERWRPYLERVCVVDCPPQTQVARVQARSGLTAAAIARIMAAQARREDRLALADDIIDNGPQVTLAALYAQVLALHQKWLALME